jgi:hypothetical protein
MTQNNLGTAWLDLPTNDRDANLRRAIDCFQAALRVYTEQAFPSDHKDALTNLARAQAQLA